MRPDQRPGAVRSREELLCAAAQMVELADSGRLDCSDSESALRRHAMQLEQQAADAPPASQAGQITDAQLLEVVKVLFGSGWASALTNKGVPGNFARLDATVGVNRGLKDPINREELLLAARHALAGRCSCGEEHDHHLNRNDDATEEKS